MLPRFRLAAATLSLLCAIFTLSAVAQTPIALPYTMTTIAGQTPISPAAAGTQCPGLPTGVKSTDAFGDGCLAVNGVFGTSLLYGGVLVDSNGMIYVVDDAKFVIHKINPATGIMTLVAGGNTACGTSLTTYGDGCPAATGTGAFTADRAAGIDYYGNPMWGAYSSHLLHMICINASPLCVNGTPAPTAANPIQIQVGYMGYVAGCATGTAGVSGTGPDNAPGFTIKGYSISGSTTNLFNNGGTCSATFVGETNRPESYSGDVYGNIYYYESVSGRYRVVLGPLTSTYFPGNNPLYAALTQTGSPWTTVTAGYAYTIAGLAGTTTTTKGTGCNGGGTATDAFGDGCLFTSAEQGGLLAYQAGIGVDAAGNMVYTDNTRGLRVFYVSDGTNFAAGTPGYIAGQKMKNAIIANIKGYAGWTTVTAPPTGFNYMLAGGGATAIGSATPATLGSSLSFASDNKMYRLTVSPQGNIYIGSVLSPNRVYFYDINTGYLRVLFTSGTNIAAGNYCSTGTTTGSGPKSLSAFSDGCPASKSQFTEGSTLSLGVDPQGDLYMFDLTDVLVRKVLAQGFTPQTYNTTAASQTQTFQVHLPESAAGTVSPAAASVTSSPDITVAAGTNPTTPACAQNGDNTVDCTVTVTTAPTQVGQRSAALTVTLPAGTWQNASATIDLNQTATGSVMVVDSATLNGSIAPTVHQILSSVTPAAVAVDGAGNVYEAAGTNIQEAFNNSSWASSGLSNNLPATPSQIAVDPTGNIFAVNSGVPTITELAMTAAGMPSTYATTSVSYTPSSGTAAPQAVATDQFGNLYVADFQAGGSSVYRLSLSPITQTYQNQVTVASSLANPVSLAVDASGNVFVADKTAGKVYEYSPSSSFVYALANTYAVASPDAVAVDAGGDVYAQTASSIIEIPVSGPQTTVYTGLSSPVGVAVDGVGNVYSADASNTSITQIVRNNVTCNFPTETDITVGTDTCSGTVTNAGNQLTTGSVTPTWFNLTGCGVSANEMEALSPGESCALSVTMAGTSTIPLTFLPASSSVGSLTLTGTVLVTVYNTASTMSQPTPASPIGYLPSGTEATFTITVTPGSGGPVYTGTAAPGGTPLVWLCQGTSGCTYNAAYRTLTSSALTQVGSTTGSSATVTVSGLTAATYYIYASYPGGKLTGPTFGASATSAVSFTIAPAGALINPWTPGSITQQVSTAIGAVTPSVLNPTTTPAIPGNFVYTATCTSSSPSAACAAYSNTTIDASTYLPIGTYTLTATFYPTDSTDYIFSSAVTYPGYSVTQATTTAAVGASTNVVAIDGSGNYTSLSAALATLPVTGGTLYLKPGTYTGQNAISYPNVFLRGLGGDPTQILLTAENGNFAVGSYPQSSGTPFGPGPAGKAGDEGSAVLDVSKNGFMGTTAASGSYSPAGFYAEYLTIQNTYDTDTVTTSTTTAGGNGGTCVFTPSAPQTLQYLYNNNLSCGSQAQALFMNADQAILNNVNLISQQDTLYAGYQGTASNGPVPSRQYIWQGTIIGDVDYIYGDAALVMDHTNIFTTWHGLSAGSGEETITAQNKRTLTGSAGDYLSGYVCNVCTLMSQTTGMTKLYYGRPYGTYSTFVLLNSQVDQVNPGGFIGWDGASLYLSTSTYAEYNTQAYVDPAVGTAPYPSILFYPTTGAGGVIPTGGNIGYGVTASSTPAAARESSALQLTAAQAAPYYPMNFLSTTVSTTGGYSGMPTTWNPVTALATAVNSFAPTASVTIGYGSSVTILGRPQTPGAGVVPTGSYAFYDNLNTNTACTTVGGSCSLLASGNLDASGEAYLTTKTLGQGIHYLTMVYGGDLNFAASSTATPYAITVSASLVSTTTMLSLNNPNSTYGGTVTGTVNVTPASGSDFAVGTVTLNSGSTVLGNCTLTGVSNACNFSLANLAAGAQAMTASYSGGNSTDGNETFGVSASSATPFSVHQAVLQVTASNASVVVGGTMPTFGYTVTGFVNTDSSAVLSGAPAISTTATSTAAIGEYPILITTGTLAASNYIFTFTGGYLYITGTSQTAAVATGDTRTVTEPVFPAVCQQLTAAITMVNDDIPASVDATVTNPDGARIQAALAACSASYPGSGPGLAVELSTDGAGHNAFLTGPLSMPSNVTLLVDPAVVLFFSRNAQDYDKVAGTHTCGTINTSSATSSCLNLIDIPKTSTNVGIMGYGKLDGRGGDPLINAIPPYQGYSWWGLSAAYASPNSQQNPRWIQMESGSSNITLYKITLRNAPLFHVTTGGAVSNFTAWDIKIITPTTSRNTDGIDPGNATNFTITRSWISDGDDNVAVGAAGTTAPASNISITNNHFFAGHGQSFGSYTGAGISNVLWDGNMAAGNGFAGTATAGFGSAISSTGTFLNGAADSNSTGIRIKSANDRGGLVTNIQYSNECLLDHKSDIQFTPYYSSGDSTTEFPNYKNILMQNIVFMNDDSGTGTVEMTGEYNTNLNPTNGTPSPVINPLYLTLDNVTFASALATLVNSTTPVETTSIWTGGNYSGGTGQYVNLTYGPGDVSTNFITAFGNLVNVPANNDTVTNNITASSLNPPSCTFTYIAPELTGPAGVPQTITQGQNATAVVILTPAVGGAAYPTGTVTLTDALTSSTTIAPLSGTSDTVFVPLSGLTVGTHTFTATYSGDTGNATNYLPPQGQTVYTTTAPYIITVNPGSLSASTTSLGFPVSTSVTAPFGTPVTATATVSGSNPTGTVQFVVSGGVYTTGSYTYATMSLTPSSTTSSASASLSLPYSPIAYSITAYYSGDAVNAGSTSNVTTLNVALAPTTTVISASPSTAALGNPFILTAAVTSAAGTPTAAPVTFAYSTTLLGAQTTLGSVTSINGAATYFVNSLPVGSYYLFATYPATGSYGSSTSVPVTVTVTAATNIVPLPGNPIALPYTMTTIAGGGAAVPSSGNMVCTGATDKYGDGCLGTAIAFTASDDMRAVDADPFGNVYLTDISATRIRRIAANGIITTFAGGGSTCSPPASTSVKGTGCVPTASALSKPRGVSSDAAGNIYIADYSGDKVYEVKVSDGLMYLVAGTGTAASTGDGGPATAATVNAPRSAWGDSTGNIYIADTTAEKVRVVDTLGNIHTFAGTGTNSSSGDGTPALAATISNPQGVFVDANLNVYVADSVGRIRVICVTCGTGSPLDTLLGKLSIGSPVNGYIYTIAGNGTSSTAYSGTLPTLSTNVSMAPQKLSMDNSGNLYISDSLGFVWLLDFHTGYIRAIASNATTVCSTPSSTYGYTAYGDGCPATQAKFGSNGGNGLGAGTDTQGNLYISDSTNGLIRKVITGLASPSTAVAATTTLPVEIHLVANAALTSVAHTSSEWTSGTPACITNTTADNTTDCLVSSSFTPGIPGPRSAPLMVTDTLSHTANLALTGTGLGAGATLDPASQISFGANLSVAGVATDNAGNVYVSDATSRELLRFPSSALAQGASAASTIMATLTAPGAIAIDPRGFAYVADTTTGLITQISPAGTASTVPFNFITPAGLAVDAVNNLYVSDSSAQAVYQINPITGVKRTLALGTLVSPKGLSIDPSGNLLVADPGVPAIYRFNLATNTRTTVSTSASAPSAVLTDAAGNLLIADTAAILAVPASSHSTSFTVAAIAPSALAIDPAGNLYTGSNGGVLEFIRTNAAAQFASSSAPSQAFSMLESGNLALSPTSLGQTDATDYGLTATASTDCTVSAGKPTALAIGGVCALTASYTPTTYLITTDTVTVNGALNAALSTPASVQLVLTGPATGPASSIAFNAFSPAAPVYGQTVTASVTVSGSTVVPTGSVAFYLDGSGTAAATGTLNGSGVASVQLTGLSAGLHAVSATYTSTNGYLPSTTSPVASLTVSQASQAITFTDSLPTSATYSAGLSYPISATGGLSGNPVTFSLTTVPATGVATLSNGLLTITGAGTATIAANQAGNTDYSAAPQVTQSIQIGGASQAITFTDNLPVAATYHAGLSYPISATGGLSGNPVTFTLTTVPVTGVATLSNGLLTITGVGTATIAANQAAGAGYSAAPQVTQSIQINSGSQAITFTDSLPASVTYSSTILTYAISATGGLSGNPVTFTLTTVPTTGVATLSNGLLTITGVGTATIAANQAAGAGYSAAPQVMQSIQVTEAPSGVSLTSNVNPTMVKNAITLTATVGFVSSGSLSGIHSSARPMAQASAAGPTGTVTFMDGTTPLVCQAGTATLTNGVATCITNTPALPMSLGTRSLTAVYSGDANFAAGTSSPYSEVVINIVLGTPTAVGGSGSTATVFPGGAAEYSIPISPSSGTTFPAPLTFTVSGLPTGATVTLAPSSWTLSSSNPWTWTLPANTSLSGNTQLTIQVPKTTSTAQTTGGAGGANVNLTSRLTPLAFALLLLPFVGRLRKSGKRFSRMLSVMLLLAASAAAMAGLSGCGSNSGFFGYSNQNYNVGITVSSGTLSQSTSATLTVE
ncbi:MAG: pectinesterase family protein [Terracidiphilus sp.]|jgi:sugar lactone lactonase YvrE